MSTSVSYFICCKTLVVRNTKDGSIELGHEWIVLLQ
jgi:hypothetical protein